MGLQFECVRFCEKMFAQNAVIKCLKSKYMDALMQRFLKISRKMKNIKDRKVERKLLQCMIQIFGKKNQKKIAKMYDNNHIFYEWMAKYAQLAMSDLKSICFDNFLIILDGVSLCIEYCEDASFYMLYNQTKQQNFGFLMDLLTKMKKIKFDKSEKNEFEMNLIFAIMKVFNALCSKEEGRKYLLLDKMKKNHSNFEEILVFVENKQKYQQLRGFIDVYFRKLVQQRYDNEEAKEREENAEKDKKKKDDYTRSVFVSQREAVKFNALTLDKVFGDALTKKEIALILSLSQSAKD